MRWELGGRAPVLTGRKDSEGLNGGWWEAKNPVWVRLRDGPGHGEGVEDR